METLDTRVGKNIVVTGKIEGDGNVIVEGRIDGSIHIKGDLQIDPGGCVKAAVQARNIYVMGILLGDGAAIDVLELAPGGRMVGDVRSPRFLIHEGAAFRGNVDMVNFDAEERTAELRRAPAVAAPTRSAAPAMMRSAPATRTVSVESMREPVPVNRAAAHSTPARPAPAPTVYTPPPLPRPPDFLGTKKAIVIRKKASETG